MAIKNKKKWPFLTKAIKSYKFSGFCFYVQFTVENTADILSQF